MNNNAVVVFSGGQDSTTCLFWAMKKFDKVIAVTFDYGQRHSYEIECAKKIAEENNIEHHILDVNLINQLSANSLTRSDIPVDSEYDGDVPNSYVEGRNLIFFSFAAILAKTKGCNNIVCGVSQTDFSGYPDCRDNFIKSLNITCNLAMDFDFEWHTPLMWIDKADTWEMADKLGVLDYVREKTVTCYNGVIGDGCGQCPSCTLRRRGLETYLARKAGR